MGRKVHEFVVANQGYCFICFKQSQFSQSGTKLEDDSYPVYSLQCLSTYLDLDMRKAFIDDGLIPPGLLAKVTVSKLKVELCEPCASMNDNFSERFRQFEKAKMGLNSTLKDIFAKLERATKTDEVAAENRIFAKTGSFGLGKLEIVKALRDETMQKCSKELAVLVPRVRIENLSLEQVNREKLKVKNDFHREKSKWLAITGLKEETSPEPVYDSDNFEDPAIEVGDVKLETTTNVSASDYDNEFSNSDNGDSDGDSSKAISLPNTTSFTPIRSKCISNPKTDKHKCRECSKEFSSITAFYQHYRSQHLKFRYVCSVCGRKFTQVGNFNQHQRLNHKDAKFKCRLCNQVFDLESNLLKHRRTNTCADKESVEKSGLVIVRPSKVRPKYGAIQKLCSTDSQTGKLKCSLCSEEFQIMSSFRIHYNRDHLQVRYRCTLCQKEFTTRKMYASHHARHHMNETFDCTKCSKLFKTKHDLQAHLRTTDCTKLPKYSCNVCNKTFLFKKILSLHQQTSSGCGVKVKKPNTPVKCPETLAIIHPRNSPKEGGKKLYKVDPKSGKYLCKICSKEFANRTSFQIHHKSVHLKIRYRCTLCLKEFTFRSSYDTHHRNIHLDKRIKCEKCHKMLKGRASIWLHRKKHCRGRVKETP